MLYRSLRGLHGCVRLQDPPPPCGLMGFQKGCSGHAHSAPKQMWKPRGSAGKLPVCASGVSDWLRWAACPEAEPGAMPAVSLSSLKTVIIPIIVNNLAPKNQERKPSSH